ncbi:glycosyltransferase family 25 protein [uncultured Helicobacter sp.]|uniref:glycosyltransferase family 25 protein n=1 Tax=uncultured Helicobacter sp. TaxID=175537 RepID=UPI002625EC86|nr:glycosyltransferase family 25 protein [uncultured Helicobacter sp.]
MTTNTSTPMTSTPAPSAMKHQIFIINLKRSADRREKMQRNIDKLLATSQRRSAESSANSNANPTPESSIDSGVDSTSALEFHFFNAQTPESILESGFATRYDKTLARVFKARDVRPTELACFASHYELWCKCVELGQGIFILEDDIDFCDGFVAGVEAIATSPYEYVRLGWSTFHTCYLIDERFALAPKLMLGAPGYYLTPAAARRLIDGAKSIFLAVDYYMSFSYLHGVAEMLYLPHLVHINELDEHSTIGKPEHVKKDKRVYYAYVLPREIHRIYRNVRMWAFAQRALKRAKKLARSNSANA